MRSGRAPFSFFILAVFLPFLFWSCEKDINIDLKEEKAKLVVEATIENGQPPMVLLSRSLDYFSAISPQSLANSIVRGADVFVSNGTKTHKLKEYSTPVGGGFSLSFYTIDSTNLATAFLGELNASYSLRIVSEGEEYTASTTIPPLTKRIDSIWWKPPPQADSDQVVVMVKITDPPGFGDYIRYFTRRNSEAFLSPTNSTFDDLFVDGSTYEIPLERGVNRNNVNRNDRERFFSRGDTVTLKLSNVDRRTYRFWQTMEFSYASIGNPFSTPVKVESNIRGNALGYFGGYASQYRMLVIPK